jgi:hypothetical protein
VATPQTEISVTRTNYFAAHARHCHCPPVCVIALCCNCVQHTNTSARYTRCTCWRSAATTSTGVVDRPASAGPALSHAVAPGSACDRRAQGLAAAAQTAVGDAACSWWPWRRSRHVSLVGEYIPVPHAEHDFRRCADFRQQREPGLSNGIRTHPAPGFRAHVQSPTNRHGRRT